MEMYGMTGERLGTIGTKPVEERRLSGSQPALEKFEDLPQWKKDMLGKPSLSVRRGISWSYGPPTEPTSTLVMTAKSGQFVDIRFPLNRKLSQPLTANLHYWAFSGISTTTFDPETLETTPMPYSAHSVFKHDIDTKGSGITDEGDMFALMNGDTMEVGMMENPETGTTEMYKEYWTSPAWEPGSGGLKKSPCVVAQGTTQGQYGKGLIIRIGDHCQGIAQLEDNGEIFVERWEQKSIEENPMMQGNKQGSRTWMKDWRSNTQDSEPEDTILPCLWVCEPKRNLGDQLKSNTITWTITEISN